MFYLDQSCFGVRFVLMYVSEAVFQSVYMYAYICLYILYIYARLEDDRHMDQSCFGARLLW